jgi:hypothetical protein
MEGVQVLTMLDTLLQTDWLTFWESGQWFEAMFRPYVALLTRAGVILLLGTPFTLALWIQTGNLAVPATFLTLFAGLIIGGAPPAATFIGYLIIVVAAGLAYRSIFGGSS